MIPNHFPYIPSHITFRRYNEINIYDLQNDESFLIDEDAFTLLKKVDGKATFQEILNQFTIQKQEEVYKALESFIELELIQFLPQPVNSQDFSTMNTISLPEKNPFEEPYFMKLMINITERCNLQCKHCYIPEKNQVDMSLDNLKKLINDFYALQGSRLILTGGEPFLYSNLLPLMHFLKKIPLQKVLLSNGILINEKLELLKLLKENYFEVFVSLDGLKEAHNDLRNANCFRDTLEGIKILLENDISVSINTMVHKENINQFDEMYNLIKSLGEIKSWAIDIPTFDKSTPDEIREKYEISYEKGAEILKNYGWGVLFESEACSKDLACGPNIMAIDVLGNLSKCGFFSDNNIGNVFNLGLKKSWEAVQADLNWNMSELKCFELNCKYLDECRGGCRYRAYTLTGDILGVDKYKCYQFGRLGKNKK